MHSFLILLSFHVCFDPISSFTFLICSRVVGVVPCCPQLGYVGTIHMAFGLVLVVFFSTVCSPLSEDSFGLMVRSEPTELRWWIPWTSVCLAGALGGGFGAFHPSITSFTCSILVRTNATRRERSTRSSARDRRSFHPARLSFFSSWREETLLQRDPWVWVCPWFL